MAERALRVPFGQGEDAEPPFPPTLARVVVAQGFEGSPRVGNTALDEHDVRQREAQIEAQELSLPMPESMICAASTSPWQTQNRTAMTSGLDAEGSRSSMWVQERAREMPHEAAGFSPEAGVESLRRG